MDRSRLPLVAVVGRPNVGKSTLVNRIHGRRAAVVEERPGVTRDRRELVCDWAGSSFILVDTGGWEAAADEPLAAAVREQAEAALAAADLVLFVVDARTGPSDDDDAVAALLRRAGTSVILAANKVDDAAGESAVAELWALGLGEPVPVSALHGRGVGDLLDAVVAKLPEAPAPADEHDLPRLAIVGRPNVGKSTLLNRLAGERRVIVSETPGTTRDPIDVAVDIDGRLWCVVDTAGIRRRPRITESADRFSVVRAHRVVAEADVAVLVLDAVEGVTQQDQRIAAEVAAAGTGLVVLLNKWDLADAEQRRLTERGVAERLGFVGWAPVLRGSALTGSRLGRLGPLLDAVLEARSRRIPTAALNRLVARWAAEHPPPIRKGRRPRLLYAVQAGVAPPTVVLFIAGGEPGPDYLRFVEKRLREEADFTGTPVPVVARARRAATGKAG